MPSAQSTVERFNTFINAANLEGLSALMTDDHTFVDSAGASVAGKSAVSDAWASFFAAFPDYRNEFQMFRVMDDEVFIVGRSACSDARLNGPALWRARVRGDKVSTWQVYEDTPAARARLGL